MDDDYVNDDCPEQCCIDHDVDDSGDRWECPATGQWFAYCNGHNEQVPVYSPGRSHSTYRWTPPGRVHPTYFTEVNIGPDGESYCDDCFSETWTYCDDCGDTVARDEARWVEDDERDVCSDCHRSNYPEHERSEPLHRCERCNTIPAHPHLLTEALLCDCEAHRAVTRNEPVMLRRPLLRVPTTVVDDYGVRQDVVRQVVAA